MTMTKDRGTMVIAMNREAEFDKNRSRLLGLAYRLLGSMWDAEDIVQEAYLRWTRIDPDEIHEPRAFLATVVSRLALDQLRSARVTREAYPGPWLPEPVSTEELGPLETAELRDTLSYATLHMMERLSPPERAVFVLREAFGTPYADIAGIVGASMAACRQLHHRAAERLAAERGRFQPTAAEHARLLENFLEAAQNGDLLALTGLLSEDVVAWNDGGGQVRAALRPITGRVNVLAFVTGLLTRNPIDDLYLVEANGELAVWTVIGGQEQLVTIAVRDGRISAVYGILNPNKLSHVRRITEWAHDPPSELLRTQGSLPLVGEVTHAESVESGSVQSSAPLCVKWR
jgi:RNA polymerase sigma-70 factor, ECF subfamily